MSQPSNSELLGHIEELRALVAALTLRVRVLENQDSESTGSFELTGPAVASAASSQAVDPADHGARAALARQIGAFVKKALAGDSRGSSGRDRLRLSSRYYLVFASFDGERYNPPRLCDNFGEVIDRLLVPAGGIARSHYELVNLVLPAKGDSVGPVSVNLIAISEVADSKLLVAAPFEAWSKTASERILPKGALQRAILLEVSAALSEDPEAVLEESTVKVWVGLLEAKLVKKLQAGPDLLPTCDIYEHTEGGGMLIPHGPSLGEVVEDHFTFHSATSAAGGIEPDAALEQRLAGLEQSIGQIRDAVLGQAGGLAPIPPTAVVGRPKAKSALAEHPHLDPEVLASARQAGVSEDQIATLASLLKKNNRMQDGAPGVRPGRRGVLSETEDEEEDIDGEPLTMQDQLALCAQGADPAVNQAVVQLTKLVGNLSKQSRSKKDLNAILDSAEGSSDSSASTSSSRSKAAAYKRLKDALTDSPKLIVKALEEAIEEDYVQLRLGPGQRAQEVSTRGWVEYRSRIQYYQNTIRFAWILSGIHNAMRASKWDEARARVLLGLAAIDQSSLDGGSWMLSQEMLLEPAPPFASFVGRRLPDPAEQAVTRIIDDRWADVLLWRLKEKDSFIETRKRLQQARPAGGGKGGDQNNSTTNNPPENKPKKNPKGKAKGDKATPEKEPPTNTA
eukprot:Skav212694  [mRNA]  locus=scaffold1930:276574:278753:+ [translate_table: standard]